MYSTTTSSSSTTIIRHLSPPPSTPLNAATGHDHYCCYQVFATSLSLVVTSTLSVCLLDDGEGTAPPLFWLGVALVVCATLIFEGRKPLIQLLQVLTARAAVEAAAGAMAGKAALARGPAPIDVSTGVDSLGQPCDTFDDLCDADKGSEKVKLTNRTSSERGSAALETVKCATGVKQRSVNQRSSFDRLCDVDGEEPELGAEEPGAAETETVRIAL